MELPLIPQNEQERLETLKSLNILDTPPQERFDRITRLAKRLFGVPIALVSLVDTNRQWFLSAYGTDAKETSRDISFCGHAINQEDILAVPDTLQDPRFHENPLVSGDPNIRFYAGRPISVGNNSKIGTLCLIDQTPRQFSQDDEALLNDLAEMVEQEFSSLLLASVDPLTLISNRRGFETLANHALSLCKRLNKPAAMLYIDLDGFKQINDTYGHQEGDRALQAFSSVLQEVFRECDVIGRLGGDEFAVLLTSCQLLDSNIVIERLRKALKAHTEKNAPGYDIDFSVGVVEYDQQRHSDVEALMADADKLMYRQKAGRQSLDS
jgi:diguanylate cyclase (GGDEF)-like protein